MATATLLGNFDLFADGLVSGWLTDSGGNPVAVAVKVNGVVATTVNPKRRWPWARRPQILPRGSFEVRLRLRAGDRVEISSRLTGQPLQGVMRRAADPRWLPRVALVAPIKQETPYLLEWIAYHRALGVENFMLGDNGGDDHTSDLLEALDGAGLITRLDWRGHVEFQVHFDVDAIRRMTGRADVCCITDVDEFIRPMGERQNIPSAIAEIFSNPGISAAALNWASYGSSGRIEPGEGLVIERFTRRAPDDDPLHRVVKSLVRPERFDQMANPHEVRLTSGEYVNDSGEPVRWKSVAATECTSWTRLRVDHFVVKSRREFEMKKKRGRPDLAPGIEDRDEPFFLGHDSNETLDPMPDDFVARTKDEMARIRQRLGQIVPPGSPVAKLLQGDVTYG